MMRKAILLLLGVLLFSFINYAYAEDTLIEPGDKLVVYLVNNRGVDVVTGLFTNTVIPGKDPHEIQVSFDGRAYIPNIGNINVSGKTTREIQQLIDAIYGPEKLKETTILCTTRKYNDIYVVGEVKQQGLYRIDKGHPAEMRLQNILGLAGGFSEFANKQDVHIISKNGRHVVVNISRLIADKYLEQNLLLNDQDIIVVGQSVSKVMIVGEVKKPGGYNYIEANTLCDYLAEAGGVDINANPGDACIVRRTGDQEEIIKVPLQNNGMPFPKDNARIMPGDLLIIPKSMWADWRDLASIIGLARDMAYIYSYLNNK